MAGNEWHFHGRRFRRRLRAALQAGRSWAVVETPAMTARASELATDRLRFFTDIDGAAEWLGYVDVMHSNCALQYPDAFVHYVGWTR